MVIGRDWRKPVGVEPTRDTKYRTTGLKPAPSTGQDWLPRAIVADGRLGPSLRGVGDEGYTGEQSHLKFPGRLMVGQRPLEP